MSQSSTYDCVVCGSCVVDVLVRPVSLDQPIGYGELVRTEPLELTTGGIVSNAGITMARLGMNVAAMTYVGNDAWADVIRTRYEAEGIDTAYLVTHNEAPSSTSAVLIDPSGERSFLHAVGAPKKLDKGAFLDQLDLFSRARVMLLGYYPLLPNLQEDLPEVLAKLREVGCQTALDSSADGGDLHPLDLCLPHLDYYVPSLKEATHQTNEQDPQRILQVFREAGAQGLIGVKLGSDGALLSPAKDQYIEINSVDPPGEVIDTTGAGDCFLGGLLTGVLRGLSIEQAGRLAAAAGASCVTGMGATKAIRNFEETAALGGVSA